MLISQKSRSEPSGKDVRANAGDGVVAADPDLADAVITPAERPHRPWLVPGVGTLLKQFPFAAG